MMSTSLLLQVDRKALIAFNILMCYFRLNLIQNPSLTTHSGCLSTVAFANAFTKVFLDSDDTKSLNRAYKTLSEDQTQSKFRRRSSIEKRLLDSDYKDLAVIKWAKSAINLHNNHVGRQVRINFGVCPST